MVHLHEVQLEKIQKGSESCELHDHQADSHNSKQETILMKEETKALREVKSINGGCLSGVLSLLNSLFIYSCCVFTPGK